ncbi:MAG: type II toxin-antitoxin system RelE/ParE family toxin [Chloroflexi bacterium]|nr:type II toxin-antitoxin system RelE/ParE family toxin [Chloroflexota bacterium]MCY3601604.1 type II toxin-antitoxin system RelE/ParE family toxin [Chloroflexota bacterium]MCY3645528.1 type II toxin-antitoxin system RelE/ParE family toxin [Chloroflexota bacterium]
MAIVLNRVNRFRDRDAERLFNGQPVRRLPGDIQRRGRMRLQRVVAATVLSDLRVPPSHRLQALRGDRRGQHSVRINDQWRICFRWTEQGATEIEIVDYH